ncbi:hypothetical protein CORC01_01803 [Colletotrichum orchidophilum]|uniref:Uncharacterized protein n=1 Tax=Colletotrichum orchidophilum TaxID=1209926 RepID=A0A1G4BP11_9PEZI|nr:uncharacterized protein CORC01_01803 [Colletotrichum orchidophilum]OHF03045.1 hypothetical protein CORC01_01803 [Colletotrichum orchidophilum]
MNHNTGHYQRIHAAKRLLDAGSTFGAVRFRDDLSLGLHFDVMRCEADGVHLGKPMDIGWEFAAILTNHGAEAQSISSQCRGSADSGTGQALD